MAHFAKLNKDSIVTDVHVVNNDVLMVDGIELEVKGIEFLREITGHDDWVQTSYNSTFRKHYAGKGFKYDKEFDAFIAPQPFASWKLNYTTFVWEAPTPMPDGIDGHEWKWSEPNQEWVAVPIN